LIIHRKAKIPKIQKIATGELTESRGGNLSKSCVMSRYEKKPSSKSWEKKKR
jgi:hypothetical protein